MLNAMENINMNKACGCYTLKIIHQSWEICTNNKPDKVDCDKDNRAGIKEFLKKWLKALRLHEGSCIGLGFEK